MSKHRELAQKALELIDTGFDQMDRKIENASLLDRYLVAASTKAVRLADTILFLGDHGVTDEAFPVLRSLVEHAINMRWIAEEDTEQRLKMYMGDLGKAKFGTSWANKSLDKRMEDVGFGDRNYYDFCVKLTYSYAHVNASSLRWGEVFSDPRLSKNRWSPDSLCSVVTQMLGHVMKALESRYKGHFDGYNGLWQQIKVDKNVGKKIEAIRKEFVESS
ncbi:MAG: DUF5677 domain-containing protein [Patescibacteria group bacterium]